MDLKKNMRIFLWMFIMFINISLFGRNYYVSTLGNDNNDGLTEQTAWKTIEKVNTEMKNFSDGDVIAFRGGDEFFGALIIKNKNSITFNSYGAGKAIIKGSEKVTGWNRKTGNIWEASLQKNVFNVFKNNSSAINARFPNLVALNDSPNNYLKVTSVQNSKNEFTSIDLKGLSNLLGAQVFIKTFPFKMESFPVVGFDSSSGRIKLAGNTQFDITQGNDFYISNHANLLNNEGEWFFDKSSGKLLLYTLSNPDGISASVVNDSGVQLFYSNNNKIKNLIVRDFNVNGILVDDYSSNNEITNSDIKYCYNSGVFLATGDGNNINNNTIENSINYGIRTIAANYSIIQSNRIDNIFLLKDITFSSIDGKGAIYIGSETNNSIVKGNRIQNVGHNAINITRSSYTIVKENYIKNFCLTLEDGGGIYLYGSIDSKNNGNCKISNNIILDYENFINPRRTRFGIYLDDHSHDATVTLNSISGTNHGIFLHNAYKNTISFNNIYETIGDGIYLNADSNTGGTEFEMVNNKINNNDIFLSRTNVPTIFENVEYATATPLAVGIKSDWARYNFGSYDFNRYYTTGTLTPIGIKTTSIVALGHPTTKKRMMLKEWVSLTGQDVNSKVAPNQLDNFNLISKSEKNLINNGNSDTAISGWQKWNTTIQNNSEYLHIVPSETSGSVITPLIPIQNTKDYLFEFDAYVEKTSTILINVVQNSNWSNVYETYLVDVVSGWNSFRFPFTKKKDGDINIEFKLSVKQGFLDIDNIKFSEAIFGNIERQSFFAYNDESISKVISIPVGDWEDLDGNLYNGTITLQPFTSKILIISNKSLGIINANAGSDEEICLGENVTLTASGGTTYSWSNGATTKSISVNPTATTTYTVTVSEESASDTDDVLVTVNTVTAGAGGNQTITEGENVTLTASGGDSYLWSTGETTQSIVVSPTTTITYTVTASKGGCEDTDNVKITVNEASSTTVTANAGSDRVICLGESVTLTASGGSAYKWSNGATTKSINVNPNTTTTYSVTVSEGGNSDSDHVIVMVNSVTANAGSNSTIKEGESVTLTATGGDTYLWSTGAKTKSITINPNKTTIYSVTVYKNNCEDSDSVQVSVNPNIVTNPPPASANAGDNISICLGESVTLSATGGDSYVWSSGDTKGTINVSPSRTTTYTLNATRGGTTDTDTVVVTVENCNATLELAGVEEFLVYPNPTSGNLNLQLNSLEKEELNLVIMSLNGSIIYRDAITSNKNGITKKIDVSRFAKGIYLVHLFNESKNLVKKVLFL